MEKLTVSIDQSSKPMNTSFAENSSDYMKKIIAESDRFRAEAYKHACNLRMTD